MDQFQLLLRGKNDLIPSSSFLNFNRTALESPPNIGYSKVRVAFDNDRSSSARYPPQTMNTMPYNSFSPNDSMSLRGVNEGGSLSDFPLPSLNNRGSNYNSNYNHNGHNPKGSPTSTITTTAEQQIIGDVTEPIWVQNNKEGSVWYEPDELFFLDAKRYITSTDKRIFWEMSKALIELPEISLACKTGIKNSVELANALKRPEYKILWTKEAPDILPKEIAAEIIRSVFINTGNNQNNNLHSNSHGIEK